MFDSRMSTWSKIEVVLQTLVFGLGILAFVVILLLLGACSSIQGGSTKGNLGGTWDMDWNQKPRGGSDEKSSTQSPGGPSS